MSDGSWQGVSKPPQQSVVDAKGLYPAHPTLLETIEEEVAEGEGGKIEENTVDVEHLEADSSDGDDDPFVQELKAELEQSTFQQPNFGPQQLGEGTKQNHPSAPSHSYTSRIAVLMESMNEEQMNRFEAYRRSTLSRANMKKLVSSLIHQTLSDEKVNIVLCSLGKMFVGDLIETARRIANEENHVGALTRSHVYQAHKALWKENKLIKRKTGRFFGRL